MSEKIFKPEWIKYTKWWHRIPLWFKKLYIVYDPATGEDCTSKIYYKRLMGRAHILKIENLPRKKCK